MNIPFQPVGDQVLLEPTVPSQISKAGLFLPEIAVDKHNMGTVVAIGPGKRNTEGSLIPMETKVGDRVVFEIRWPSRIQPVKLTGKEYLVMREDNVLCVY